MSPLQGLENVILTPHIGGSTEEAQERIGAEVARKLVDYSDSGSTMGAVNFPQVQLPPRPSGTRFIQVQRNVPGMLGRLNEVLARHCRQHRRAILRDRPRRRLRGARRRCLRSRRPACARGHPGSGGHHSRPIALRIQGLSRAKSNLGRLATEILKPGRLTKSYDSRISSSRRPSVLSSFFTALDAAMSPWLA